MLLIQELRGKVTDGIRAPAPHGCRHSRPPAVPSGTAVAHGGCRHSQSCRGHLPQPGAPAAALPRETSLSSPWKTDPSCVWLGAGPVPPVFVPRGSQRCSGDTARPGTRPGTRPCALYPRSCRSTGLGHGISVTVTRTFDLRIVRTVTAHTSYQVPNLVFQETPHIVQMKVLDLVSEARFPAHLPLSARSTLLCLHEGIQKRGPAELRTVMRFFRVY